MSVSIHKVTDQYIADLLESEDVSAYTRAVEKFKEDPDTKKLLDDFNEAQQTLLIFQQGGFTGVEAQQRKVAHLKKRVDENEKIQNLIKSQQNIQVLVGDLAARISQGINFSFTPAQRGGCCG